MYDLTKPNLNHLVARAELLRKTRRLFDQRGFYEVQPPCLSRDCVVDAYLDPLTVDSSQLGVAEFLPNEYFLQTSPESAMKRMLVEGAPSIYSIGPVFRAGELSEIHNPEFTMLEWYEVGGNAESAIDLLGGFVSEVLGAGRFERITYRQAFVQSLGLDPIDTPLERLIDHVSEIDSELGNSLAADRDALLDIILSVTIAPQLGWNAPMIMTDYPLSQAALAKPSATDPECAARFECFVSGIEIANGYDELLDAQVLRKRAKENNHKRSAAGRRRLNVETLLSQAMGKGLPQCSGVAVGFDRLLMLTVGEKELSKVIPFSIRNA